VSTTDAFGDLHGRTAEENEALIEAERRLARAKLRLKQADMDEIANFRATYKLGDEVELGLRMLDTVKLRKLLGGSLRSMLPKESDGDARMDAVLRTIGQVDKSAEDLVRRLMEKDRMQREQKASGRGIPPGLRRTPPPRSGARPPEPRPSAAAAARARPAPRSDIPSARSRSPRRPAADDELSSWLAEIDTSGSMTKYLPALRREFANLQQVSAALVEKPYPGKSVLSCIEPTVFQALGVESLGHRLVLAKGIAALSASLGQAPAAAAATAAPARKGR